VNVPARLIESWHRALDAFGDALADDGEERYFSRAELRELERRLAEERRWLRASIRNFP
jgi:hypothetical protein